MATPRLPVPGKDDGTWGELLNEYLLVAHNNDGSLKATPSIGGGVDEAYVANAIQGKADRSELSAIATSGSYADLAGKPDVVLHNDTRLTNSRIPVDDSVSTAKLQDESITEPKLAASNDPANGHFLAWNGTALTWQAQAGSPVQSVNGHTGTAVVTKGDVGLGNVDNTNDASKPISTATQTALDAKATTASLSSVATSGSYTDLTNRPTLPAAGTGAGNYAAGNDERITGALQASLGAAKGDLIAATAASSFSRLPAGTDGQVLVSDSGTATGLRWASSQQSFSRTTTVISTSTTAMAAPSTDYIYIITSPSAILTLPTAIDNTALYFVKNANTSQSVTLGFTNAQTADGGGVTLGPLEAVTLKSNQMSDGDEMWIIL